ncbi:MAG: glycosyltransferase family 4 protein [Candidatus Wallbacteria bacterium]|nr:glycosyltransferase family 4 protein [Candidatus Wallbacteria bacterium]
MQRAPGSTQEIVVARVIARLNIGGPAVHVGLVCQGLDRLGYRNHLLTGRVEPNEGDMEQACTDRGVLPEYIDTLGRSLRATDDLRALAALIARFRQIRPAIVHTHTSKAGTLGRLAALACRVPVVVHTFHGHVFEGYFGRAGNALVRLAERSLARITSRIVVLGERQRDDLARFGVASGPKVVIVPNGLDLEPLVDCRATRRHELREELGIPGSAPVAGIIGRLTAVKAHEQFLQMAALLRRRCPEAHFLVVGDGERRQELEALSRELSLAGRVHFTGWRRDLASVYGSLDVLVLTSRNEGSPVVLKEGMAAGVPCVSFAVGGVPDLLREGVTGFLVAPGDVDRLANRVLECLLRPDALGPICDVARREVLAGHGAARMISRLDFLYRELLSEAGVLAGQADGG